MFEVCAWVPLSSPNSLRYKRSKIFPQFRVLLLYRTRESQSLAVQLNRCRDQFSLGVSAYFTQSVRELRGSCFLLMPLIMSPAPAPTLATPLAST